MRIALVKSRDTARDLALTGVQYPVNLGYLAQACLDRGHQVRLWDHCVEPDDAASVTERLESFRPDVVGITCVTPAVPFGHQVAAVVKAWNPEAVTLVGGAHVAALPLQTLGEYEHFDLGVVMEGEEILVDILQDLAAGGDAAGIPGTVYRSSGKVQAAPCRAFADVNSLPFPARELIDDELYGKKHSVRGFSRSFLRIAEVFTSRGCPFSCSFCDVKATHGDTVRLRHPDNVHAEIAQCVARQDANFVVFNDPTFTANKNRAREIVNGLPKLGIEGYTANAHVRTVDSTLLEAMARTGCRCIAFGVESGSDRVLETIGKQCTVEDVIRAFDAARGAGIPQLEGTFILGADLDETRDDVAATEALIRRLEPDILALTVITPYPGTEQYRQMRAEGLLDEVGWEEFQSFSVEPPPWRTRNFSSEQLLASRNGILRRYYWRPGYALGKLRKIRSLRELGYYAGLAGAFFRVVIRGNRR